jgi:AAHS family 4-hydroxybenzoate transporter-like MFS transporter
MKLLYRFCHQSKAQGSSTSIDVDRVIEGAPFRGVLLTVTTCLFVTLLLDGMDFTMLGYLMPVVAKYLGASRSMVVIALAVSPIGAALGGFIGGYLGDRWGRRRTLFASILLFGCGTIAIATSPSMMVLVVVRFLASVGLGGATPNVASLLSELLPRRLRSQVMSAAFVGFPLGAAANGLLIPLLLPHFGWRAVALFGGAAPLLLALPLLRFVPESPGFLTFRPTRRGELATLLQKINPNISVSVKDQFVISRPPVERVGLRALLSRPYGRDTLALWLVGFSNQFAAVSFSSWATSALTAVGFGYYTAVHGLMASNLAGALGAVVGGWSMARLGSRKSLRLFAVLGIATTISIFIWTSNESGSTTSFKNITLIVTMALAGISIAGVQLGEYPLSTHLYPTRFRASGVGWMVAVSRLGATSAVSAMGFTIKAFGSSYLFAGVAVAIGVTWCALGWIQAHIEKALQDDAGKRHPVIRKSCALRPESLDHEGGIHGSLQADPDGFGAGFAIALAAQKTAQ